MAGVVPVIFAASIMAFPPTVGQLIASRGRRTSRLLQPEDAPYIVGETIFIILFTYFYTAVTFNPVDQAENLKKYGGFIPGVRPGPPDGGVPRPHPRAPDVPRRAVPRGDRGAADDPHQPDERELLLRRHLAAHRRGRGPGHDEAARGAADDAQLRGLPEVGRCRAAARRVARRGRAVGRAALALACPSSTSSCSAPRARARAPRPSACRRTSRSPTSRPATSCARPSRTGPTSARRPRSTWTAATSSPTR